MRSGEPGNGAEQRLHPQRLALTVDLTAVDFSVPQKLLKCLVESLSVVGTRCMLVLLGAPVHLGPWVCFDDLGESLL